MTVLRSEPTLKPGLFCLPDDPVASQILIPGFRSARRVVGAFGWFTAGWIDRLAPGLAEYLNRSDPEPVVFTVAPVFFADERTAVERGLRMTPQEAAEAVARVFLKERPQASTLGKHALDCLAWMIGSKCLQLRIAVPKSWSNYHPKIWLFDDGLDQVVARGSGNATLKGVAEGVEHLDVDVSWQLGSEDRVARGVTMVDDWSRGASFGLQRVVDLPQALVEDIIRTAPSLPPQPRDYTNALAEIRRETSTYFKPARRLALPDGLEWETGRYGHQGDAVKSWETAEPPNRGVVSMATGAGKTITALICATRAQDRVGADTFLVVISAPSLPLIAQWHEEVARFSVKAVVPSLEPSVDKALTHLFRGLQSSGTHVLIVTNNLLCSPAFQATVKAKLEALRQSVGTMLIADEAHTLGADSFVRNKPEMFKMRLALSATPHRQYDPDGTEEIFAFFGQGVYEFGIDRAIGFCLSPYNYYVHACTLEDDEIEEFERLTRRIVSAHHSDDTDSDEKLRQLLIARRRIIETSAAKIGLLRSVLRRRGPRALRHALIYASAKNPQQFDEIGRILTELNIKWAPVTQETTAKPRLLQSTLQDFQRGLLQVLLAKKVLDEGVDIPSIQEAFIVASSSVEREWIQRRGRVLRMHPEKRWALIHDFLCLPPADLVQRERTRSLMGIVENELHRAYAFGGYARNGSGRDGVAAELDQIRAVFWPVGPLTASQFSQTDQQRIAASTPEGEPW